MAHRVVHVPFSFIALNFCFVFLFSSFFLTFAVFGKVSAENAFSASHTATAQAAVARDLR